MKNFNLIEWLQTDSHEKQSATRDHHGTKSRELAGNPRPLRYLCATLALPLRYVAMILCVLMLGVGEMWGATEDIDVKTKGTTSTTAYTGSSLTSMSSISFTATGGSASIAAASGSYTQFTTGTGSGVKITFTPKSGVTVSELEFTLSSGNSKGSFTYGSTNATITNSSKTHTISGLSLSSAFDIYCHLVSGSSSQSIKVTNIKVTYSMGTPRTFKSGEKIYFKDYSSNMSTLGGSIHWKNSGDGGNIYAKFYDASAKTWTYCASNATVEPNYSWDAVSAIYKIIVPGSGKEYTKVIFTRGTSNTDGNTWNSTTEQTPEIGKNMFIIKDQKSGDYWLGDWSKYAPNGAVIGSFNDWDPDKGALTDGRVILELEAETDYELKVLVGDGTVNTNYWSCSLCSKATTTVDPWQQLYSNQDNWSMTSGEAGEYCFHWNNSSHELGIYYPEARLTKKKYIYFNGNANTSWNGKDPYHAKFSYKYYDTGDNHSDLFCSNDTSPESHIYYTAVPNNDYIGRVQVMCMWTDHSAQHYYANTTYASARTSTKQNCLVAPAAGSDGINLTWGTYCPPTKSETFTDNSTSVISWTSGTGTSENPYLVPASGTIKVQASASKTVADGNMTINYDFKVGGTSKQAGTGTTYSHGSLSNNTTYTMTVDAYTVYNLDGEQNSTKHTPTALYYKALTTYSVTHNVNHASSSDRTGSGAAAYYLPYSATFTPATGYNLPATITVKFGSSTKTSGTDYTWNSSTGVLTIPASKIDGDVTIKFDGVAKTTAITLDPNTANHGTAGDGSAVATYDATSLTSVTHTTPAADYQLKGYYTAKTDGTKIINADGSFVTATTTYTTSDGKWKSELAELTLYAQYEEIEYCYTHTLATSGSAPADYDVIAGTYSGGIMEKIGGTLTYGTNGLNFESGSSSKVSVALENNMQAGSVVTIVMVTESNSARGLIIANSSGTAKATYSESTSGTYTKTYKVVAGDGLAGSNVFQVHRNNNARLKSIKVGNCGSAATKYDLAMSLTNVSQTSSWVAGSGKVVTGSNFTATFEAADCYLLPATITVTIGGASKTAGTDYYWTQATGKLVIPGSNVTGNIAITISGADNHSAAGLSYGTASVSKKTTDGKFTNSLSNPNSLTVSYESDDEDVATVDSDGEVTIKGVGSCTIKASADAQDCYNSGSASYTLTVSDLSDEKKLLGLKFSNGFDAFINESSHAVTAYYLYGTSAPTITSHTESDGATYSIDGTTITITAEDASTQDYTLTLSTVNAYAGTGSEETFTGSETYIKGGIWDGSAKKWTFRKNSDADDRQQMGLNRLYFFVDECSKITLKSAGTNRAIKVYRNGTKLDSPTASGSDGSTMDIEGSASAALYAIVANQGDGDTKFSTITIVPNCTVSGLSYGTTSVGKNVGDAKFTNTLTNANSAVVYSSTLPGVATVSNEADHEGEVTIVGAGTTTIKATIADDDTYCDAEVSYTLTVYPVYTVSYNAMGGTCTPTTTNTTTDLGKVTLPSATNSTYDLVWVTSDGTPVGEAGEKYAPTGNITLYAKWSGSCAGGGGSGEVIFKAHTKTSGLNDKNAELKALTSSTLCTTDNFLSELEGGTLTLVIGGSSDAQASKDSLIRILDKDNAYFTIALSGGKALQAGDIITIGVYAQNGTIQKTSSSYSAATDLSVGKDARRIFVVPNSLVGATTFYIKAASNNMDFAYVEVYRPSETLLYMHVKEGLENGNMPTDETQQTTSNNLAAVSGGTVYAGATTSGHIKIVNTNEIQLNNGTGYLKLVLPKALAQGDVLRFNSSTNYELAITTGTPRAATIYTSGKVYKIPAASSLIGASTIYLWYYSSAANVKTLTVIRPDGGGSTCYTVTYDGNGADGGYTNDPAQYVKDADPTVLENGFTRTGYEFVGWNTEDDGSGTPYAEGATITDIDDNVTLYAQWRVLISSDNTNFSGYTSVGSSDDVRVTNGATLTITSTRTIHDITIDDGATLNVSTNSGTGITFTVNSLHLKGGLTSVGGSVYNMPRVYIDSKSTLVKDAENPIVNFDISVDTRNFYPIAVPFRVKVKDVDYANSFLAGYSNYGLTGQYVIKEYDGARRAEKGPDQKNNWKVVPETDPESGDDVYLEPGKGYILTAVSLPAYGGGVIRFPLEFTNAWTALGEQGTVSAVTKNVVAVTAHTGKATEGDKYANKGWNLLGVPFMSCYATGTDMGTEDVVMQGKFNFDDGTWDGKDTHRYVNVPLHDFSEYVQVDMEDDDPVTVLRPGWCFFVQIGTTGSLTFLTEDQAQSSTLPIYAPKRTAEMPTVKTGIILSDGEKSDKTTLLISDKYNGAEYEINADLEKMFGSAYTLATYSLAGSTRLAYNAMSRSDAQLAIPIGYRAPAEGSYTFSINPRYAESGAFSRVDLIDYEAGTLTNLLMSDYTFTTERTQNDTRFAINVVLAPQVTTDIESVNGEGLEVNGVRKVLINNELYIVVDGKMFDATGKIVKGGQK